VTSPRGNASEASAAAYTTTYGYDADGNKTTVTDPLGDKTTTAYDGDNHKSSVTDALGKKTLYTYDAEGDLLAKVDPLSAQTSYTYTGDRLLSTVTDPDSNKTTYTYDADGHKTAVATALGTTTWTYDADGHQVSMVDPRGNVSGATASVYTTTYAYDADGNRTAVTDPLGHTTTTAYNADEQKTSVTDPTGAATTYTYTADGQPLTVSDALSDATSYTYTSAGKLATRTDPNGHVTTFAYDADARLTSQTNPLSKTIKYTYDLDGNRITVTDARGITATTTYDARNLPTAVTYSDSEISLAYSYDADGHTTSQTDTTGTYTQTFDADGRLLTRTQPGSGGSFTYTYDPAGNVTARTYPDGEQITYTYSDNLIASETANSGTTSYTYNPDGQLLTTELPSGNGYTETRTYDAAGQLASIVSANSTSTLASWTATRDADNRPTSIAVTRSGQASTLTYAYDSDGRVTTACTTASTTTGCPSGSTVTTYTYDKVGNRLTETVSGTTTTYTYNAADELSKAVTGSTTTNYAYDADGNQTTAGADNYTYDAQNKLLTATIASVVYTFTNDADGNRVTTAKASTVTQIQYWDVQGTLPQLATLAGATSSTLVGDFSYDPTGAVQAEHTAAGVFYDHHDLSGSVTDLTNASGVDQYQDSYDAFGDRTVTKLVTTAPTQPFGFTGGLQDQTNSGDIDLRARVYNPATGRFMAQDPIELRVDDPYVSAYAYANDAPTYMTDPSGLTVIDASSGSFPQINPYTPDNYENCNRGSFTFICTMHESAIGISATQIELGIMFNDVLIGGNLYSPFDDKVTTDRCDNAIPNASATDPAPGKARATGYADIIEWEPDQVNIWEVKYSTAVDARGDGPAETTLGPVQLQRYIDQMKVKLHNEGNPYWENVEPGYSLAPDAGPNIFYPSQTLYTWSSTDTQGLILYHPSDGSREQQNQNDCDTYPQAGYYFTSSCTDPLPYSNPLPYGDPVPAPNPEPLPVPLGGDPILA